MEKETFGIAELQKAFRQWRESTWSKEYTGNYSIDVVVDGKTFPLTFVEPDWNDLFDRMLSTMIDSCE